MFPAEPPIPIERPAPPLGRTSADGTDWEKYRERVLALFAPEVRDILSRIPANRVPELETSYLGRTGLSPGLYTRPRLGHDSHIEIADNATDPERTLREEYLHAANFEYEPFAADARMNWQGLWRPLYDAFGGRVPPPLVQDPPHAFTQAAERSLTDPQNMSLDLYRYFLPLRQGVQTD